VPGLWERPDPAHRPARCDAARALESRARGRPPWLRR
jgi:hypothetical protein